MNILEPLLGRRGWGEEAGVMHLRLPDPLATHLTAFDFHNRRVKVYDAEASTFLSSEIFEHLVYEIEEGSRFSKLTVYAGDGDEVDASWAAAGFVHEGTIAGFHQDDRDARLWSRFAEGGRGVETDPDEHRRVLDLALSNIEPGSARPEQPTRLANANDAEPIARLLQAVFAEYPSDLSAEHLAKQIATHRTVFRVVEDSETGLVAAASAELDLRRQTAEITDCVTHPDARGRGLSTALVTALQTDLVARYRITAAYSLARALEPGINRVLARLGYEWQGRLVNNCRMPTGWESMNVWSRMLDRPEAS